jgi:prepilin-type processing-associated H-X9-DG protein
MFILPYLDQQPLYNAYNQQGDSLNNVTLDGLLLYVGPVNETVTTTRLNTLTCPSDVPNAPLEDVTSHNENAPGAGPSVLLASRSRHPGGASVVLGDGSVRFIKNSINLTTLRALSTTRGSEIISADAF